MIVQTKDKMMIAHREALKGDAGATHQFLLTYESISKTLYGFVEGEDDLAYYHCIIKRLIPSGWDVRLISAGGKDNVLGIIRNFNWKHYNRNRIIFLVDRDLDDALNIVHLRAKNLYMTDKYSIENEMVSKDIFRTLFESNCKIRNATITEYDEAANKYEAEFAIFKNKIYEVMQWIVYNRFRNTGAQYKKLEMTDIFTFDACNLLINANVKTRKKLYTYIKNKCGGKFGYQDKEAKTLLNDLNYCDAIIRGKYIMWFFVKYFNQLIKNHKTVFKNSKKEISRRCELNENNFIQLTSPYSDTPDTLQKFIKHTFQSYIRRYNQ